MKYRLPPLETQFTLTAAQRELTPMLQSWIQNRDREGVDAWVKSTILLKPSDGYLKLTPQGTVVAGIISSLLILPYPEASRDGLWLLGAIAQTQAEQAFMFVQLWAMTGIHEIEPTKPIDPFE